jgi:hypothetical protein
MSSTIWSPMPEQRRQREAAAERLLEVEREFMRAQQELGRTGSNEARSRYKRALEACAAAEAEGLRLLGIGMV